MEKKLKYELPQVRDLSGLGASGQGPLYLCSPLGMVASPEDCFQGAQAGGLCSMGLAPVGAPAACTPGTGPATNECITGYSAAQTQCITGTSAVGGTCNAGGAPA